MNTFRQSSWVVTLSLAAIAIVYLKFVWLPGRRAIQEMSQQVEMKQAFLAQSTGVAAMLVGVQHQVDRADSIASEWDKASPGKRGIPQLYGTINSLAKEAHLATGRFDPQPFVTHERLREIPLTMSCTGSFSQLHEFLRELEGLPATIWVDSIRLEKLAPPAQDVQCELSLVVFTNNPQDSDYAKHTN
jgi:Tfp pilus assembly protein PilO